MKLDHDEFAVFWAAFPRRTAKIDAMKAYVKARTVASAAEILDGVERYKQHLPEEVRFICHPATFLNQGRWMDEYDEPAPVVREHWFEECKREHNGACEKAWAHHLRMRESA